MKRIRAILTCCLLLMGFLTPACETEQAPALTLKGQPSFNFPRDGGSQYLSFTCNQDWTLSSTAAWLQVSPSSGTASGADIQVTLTAEPNGSYNARSTSLILRTADLSETITVTQETGLGLIISQKAYELTNAAQTLQLTVQQNVDYQVEIDGACQDWITRIDSKGLSSDKVLFSIAANTAYDERQGSITFRQVGGTLQESVTVRQGQTNGLFVTTPEYELSNAAHTLSVEVKANVAFEVTSQASWISCVESKALDASTIVLAVAANETYSSRSGTVQVKQTNGDLSGLITITQSQTDGLIVSPGRFDLTNQAQTVEVQVDNNVPFCVVIPDDAVFWLSVRSNTQTKALTSDVVVLGVRANTAYSDREASITFKQVGGPLAQTIVVRQSQTYGLLLSTPEYELSNEAHTLSVEVKANVEFEVISQASWIHYVETKALSPSTLTLNVDANTSYDTRSGTVLVRQTNGDLSATLTVTQSPALGLSISPTSFQLSALAQTVEFQVQNNVPFSVIIPDDARSWVSVQSNTQTKAPTTTDRVVLSIAENTGYEDRETSVTFKQTDGALAQTAIIRQSQAGGLVITTPEHNLSPSAHTLNVEVRSNAPFTVTSQASWIHYVQTKALSSSTVTLNVDANASYESRSGTVLVQQGNGGPGGTITVRQEGQEKPAESGYIVVGYATYWESTLPDPTLLTHINYAFAHIKSDFETLDIKKASRLQTIAALKSSHPKLKVLLSIGGWEAGNFSEMAADATHRAHFCQNCAAAVKQYNLDGIDLDWEYPTSSMAGISSSPEDTQNFTQLVKDLRSVLGSGKLLTMASASNAKYVDFPSIVPYLDFVNLMTYDMGDPPQHNAGLYPSSLTYRSCDESVALHLKAGVPYTKMVLGIPFYGHGNGSDFDDEVDYNEIQFNGYTRRWDASAQVPYLVNSNGQMVLTYDDESSVGLKAQYVKQKGLLGAMYWNIEADDANWTLSKAIAGPLLEGTAPDPGTGGEESFLATNGYIQKYLEEVNYPNTNNPDTDQEYSYSSVIGYPGGGPSENDIELPPTYTISWKTSSSGSQKLRVWEGDWSREYTLSSGVQQQAITNLVPGTTYHWQVSSTSNAVLASGSFTTKGLLHQVYFEPNVRNGRDLGGRKGLNGKTVAYHKLYRGGRIDGKYCNSTGRQEMLAEGIRAEVDLREAEDVPSSSPLGSSVAFYAPGFDEGYNHMVRDNPDKVRDTFRWVVARLRENKPVYFHCAAGRDRTSTLAVLLEGALGVSESEMAKDYELTYFSPKDWGMSKDSAGNWYYAHVRSTYSYKSIRKTIFKKTDSGTYQERIVKYLLQIGVPQTDIDDLRSIMLQ